MLIGNEIYVEHLTESNFDWLTWRSGSITDLFSIPMREECLVLNKRVIHQYAVGYCRASTIPCRPKANCVAVMFNTDGIMWWTHFTMQEFKSIFPDIDV